MAGLPLVDSSSASLGDHKRFSDCARHTRAVVHRRGEAVPCEPFSKLSAIDNPNQRPASKESVKFNSVMSGNRGAFHKRWQGR